MIPELHRPPAHRPGLQLRCRSMATAIMIMACLSPCALLAEEAGANGFNRRCAACHLPTGEGIPGAFPPLRSQIASFASTPAGRDYLVAVLTHGLNGTVVVDGAVFNGIMPAQGLDDAEAAAILNYTVGTISSGGDGHKQFAAEDFAQFRKRFPTLEINAIGALRPVAP